MQYEIDYYVSSAPEIATVDEKSGLVTAIAEGEVTLSCRLLMEGSARYLTCKIQVKQVDVKLVPDKDVIRPGKTTQLRIEASEEDVQYEIDYYVSSAPEIATVDEKSGLVTAVSEGEVTLSCRLSVEGTIRYITCMVQVANIKLVPDADQIAPGETTQLRVVPLSEDVEAPDSYESSNPKIATVDKSGLVTAIAEGEVTFSCKILVEGVEEDLRCNITVRKSGFRYDEDGYCFRNSYGGMYTDQNSSKINTDYYIPIDRYKDIDSSIDENIFEQKAPKDDKTKEKIWIGNCFGMSATAALFYQNRLEISDYSPKNYDEDGESINHGAYDGTVITVEDGKPYALLEYRGGKNVSKLTELIEKYQIWQYFPKWDKQYEYAKVSIEYVLKNWGKGKVYILSLHGRSYKDQLFGKKDKGPFDHAVVLDTSGKAPEKKKIKFSKFGPLENPERDGYTFTIYDPNWPEFTDEESDSYGLLNGQYGQRTIDLRADGSDKLFQLISGNTGDSDALESWGERFDILDADKLPLPEEMKDSIDPPEEDGAAISCTYSENIKITEDTGNGEKTLYEEKDGEIIADDESISVHYIVSGKEQDTHRLEFLYHSDNIKIELPGGGAAGYSTNDTIYNVKAQNNTVVYFAGKKLELKTNESSDISVFSDVLKADGTRTSVTAEGVSEAGNSIRCAMTTDEQYTITSDKNMQMDLKMYEEDDVEKTVPMSVTDEEKPVNIIEYFKNGLAVEAVDGTPYVVQENVLKYDVTIPHMVINQMYGAGEAGLCSHSFIELYNPTQTEVDLNGWSLYYRPASGGGSDAWQRLALEGKAAPHTSYLIRCAASKQAANQIPNGDQEWNIQIHENGGTALLSYQGDSLPADSPVYDNDQRKPAMDGYVDMLAIGGAEAKSPVYSEGTASASQTGQYAIRRKAFVDTDHNSAEAGDCEIIDYAFPSASYIKWAFPRNQAAGAWTASEAPGYRPGIDFGTVEPEDIPEDGKLKEGLWLAGVSSEGYTYTGDPVLPEIRVYDYKTRLAEKCDYKIALKKNRNAGQAQIVVTGLGNYAGSETADFTILPADISGDDVYVKDFYVKVKKGMQKPVPDIYYRGTKLKNKKDSTCAVGFFS